MECHPEEDNHREDEAECHDAFLGLLGSQFLHFCTRSSHLLGGVLHMAEPRTASVVDDDGEDERSACHHEGKVVGVVHAHAEAGLRPLHDFHGSGRREHRTDIDCHVEEGERGVATVSILRVVV